jgi:hypothetical protein
LFSDDQVAEFINHHFEPAWESVRPVPLVTIDFGRGHVLTRTLNGNIATYVCSGDGTLLDVLPGIYEPQTYLRQLDQFVKLFRWVRQDGDPAVAIAGYHRRQADALAGGHLSLVLAAAPVPVTKRRIERPLKLVLRPEKPAPADTQTDPPRHDSSPRAKLGTRQQLARWNLLAEDTRINERVRRLAIHRYLARRGTVSPSDVTKWLYREVLDADLDDPYLGLGKTLFASYPFDDE